MLFCVFPTENSSVPLKTILLPGTVIKSQVYLSAKRTFYPDNRTLKDALTSSSNTITGIPKFQFSIDNKSRNEIFVLGADNQKEADKWVLLLKAAATLDITLSNQLELEKHATTNISNDRSFTLDSLFMSTKYEPCPGETRVHKQLKVDETPTIITPSDTSTAKISRKLPAAPEGEDVKRSPSTSRKGSFSEKSKLANILNRYRTKSDETETAQQKPKAHVRSNTEPTKNNSQLKRSNSATAAYTRNLGIGNRIAKSAASFKGRVFGSKDKPQESIRLGSVTNVTCSGFLQHKQQLKWIRMWCVYSTGVLYAYKSKDEDGVADFVITLCETRLANIETDKNKRMYIFRLLHLNAKSIYLATDSIYEFDKWVEIFQKEAVYQKGESSPLSTPRSLISSEKDDQTATKNDNNNSNNMLNLEKYGHKRNKSYDSYSSSIGSTLDSECTDPPVNSPASGGSSPGLPGSNRDDDSYWTETYVKREAFQNSINSGCLSTSIDTDSDHNSLDDIMGPGDRTSGGSTQNDVYIPKFGSSPKYDSSLKQVWKLDRKYQLNLMKTALPNKPDIFNRHLPGPNNEGLLLVNDDDTKYLQTSPSPDSPNMGDSHSNAGLQQQKCILNLAARDILEPTLSGYLDTQEGSIWTSRWCVLKGHLLYLYDAPIDDTTVNILNIEGSEIVIMRPKSISKTHTFKLIAKDGSRTTFSTDSKEVMHTWVDKLHTTSRSVLEEFRHLVDDSEIKPGLSTEDIQMQKQQLLQELLDQKEAILSKKAEKQTSQTQQKMASPSEFPSGEAVAEDEPPVFDVDNLDPNGCVRNYTRLRQRRISTQLKVDTMQKHLQTFQSDNKPKKRFSLSLGNKSKPLKRVPEPEQVHWEVQLQELTETLQSIDRSIESQQTKPADSNDDNNQLSLTSHQPSLTSGKKKSTKRDGQSGKTKGNTSPKVPTVNTDRRNSDLRKSCPEGLLKEAVNGHLIEVPSDKKNNSIQTPPNELLFTGSSQCPYPKPPRRKKGTSGSPSTVRKELSDSFTTPSNRSGVSSPLLNGKMGSEKDINISTTALAEIASFEEMIIEKTPCPV